MRVVAVDTSSRTAALVALTDASGAVLASAGLPGGNLDRRLAPALAALVGGGVDAVVVLTGPGSYSGVRAGMAAALGLATARGVPLHGVGSLVAIAAAAPPPGGVPFTAVADAGRGGVYAARFRAGVAGPEQLGDLRRCEAVELAGGEPCFATTAIDGLRVELVDAVAALGAAVPLALAMPALAAAGLTALHASPVATSR